MTYHKPGTAAVLVPFVEKDGKWHLLFEQRALHLRKQGGDICFPGGRLNEGESPREAALRETEEELLIPREEIEIVAGLDPVCGPSLGLVWPFVGVWKGHATIDMPSRAGDALSFLAAEAESTSLSHAADPTPLPLRWSEAEVDHTFLIPFSWFLEQEPLVVKTEIAQILPEDFPYDLIRGGREYNWQVKARNLYFYRHPEAVIWGVTAEIIHDLVNAYRAERKNDHPQTLNVL